MNRNRMGIFIFALAMTATLWAADPHGGHGHSAHGGDPTLPAGEYSARVKTMACGGCAPLIEKTLRNMEAIGPVHVDTKDNRIHFSVKDGKSIQWSSLQSALKKAAGQMGMGADFSLSDFQMASPPPKRAADASLSAGYYEANVGAIVCGGCKALIEKTMRSVDGVGAAQVDDQKGKVVFAVLKGHTVRLGEIQSALKVAADQMGMGADYSLSDVSPLKKKQPGK